MRDESFWQWLTIWPLVGTILGTLLSVAIVGTMTLLFPGIPDDAQHVATTGIGMTTGAVGFLAGLEYGHRRKGKEGMRQ